MIATGGRGCFISLEGGEGVGKSTQAHRLKVWLAKRGIDAILTREPGGSPKAECLRELLLEGRVAPFGNDAEALVFAIARADHVEATIRPALDAGTWVICDRFIDSTRAYQGSAGVPKHRIAELEKLATGGTIPDLTIILDLPAEVGLSRARGRAAAGETDMDRFESDETETHERRRQAFRKIAALEPDRCALIDAAGNEDAVFREIADVVAARLAGSLQPAETG